MVIRTPYDPDIRHSERGTALVAALWLSLILALLSIAVISIARKTTLKTKMDAKLEEDWVVAEGGIALAAYHIADRRNPWRPQLAPYETTIGDKSLTIFVNGPQAKIDLNGASPTLLASLFSKLGYDDDFSVKMGDRIADWRDEDDLIHLNGAEETEYLLDGIEDGPANRPFKAVHELGSVLGIDQSIYECVSPFLTVFAPSGRVDPYIASGVVRDVVGLGAVETGQALSVRRSSLAGKVYEVSSETPISDHAAAQIKSVIRFTGNPADPVWRHSTERSIVSLQTGEEDTKTANESEDIPQSCPSQSGQLE